MKTLEEEFKNALVWKKYQGSILEQVAAPPQIVLDWFKFYILSLMKSVKLEKKGRLGYRTAKESGYCQAVTEFDAKIVEELKKRNII